MKLLLYISPYLALFFLSFPIVADDQKVEQGILMPTHSGHEKLVAALKSGDPTKSDIVLKFNYLPPEGMSEAEYRDYLTKRELRNVVRGVDKILAPNGELEKITEAPTTCSVHCDNSPLEATLRGTDHTRYLGSQQVGAFTVHLLKMPLNTKSQPESSVSVLMNTGNTHLLDTTLDNGDKSRQYHYDGVIEKNTIALSKPISDQDEITFRINLFSVSDKGQVNPAQWLVGDQFIEDFHSSILGIDDPFRRKELGMNETHYDAIDHNGNTLHANEGHIYFEPAEIALTHYLPLYRDDDTHFSANVSAALGIPFTNDSLQKNIAGGISSTVNLTQKVSDKFSITAAGKGSVTNNSLVKLSDDAYEFTDGNTYEVQGLVGINDTSGRNRTSLYTSLNKTSAPTKDYPKVDPDSVNLAEHLSYQAATESNEYFEVGISYSRQRKNNHVVTLELSIREDIQLSPHTKYDLHTTGSNNEDFGAFFGISYSY